MKANWSDDFKTLYQKFGQQKFGIRLLALWKIQSGMSEKEVCQLIGKTAKTIRLWRRMYAQGGLDRLLRIQSGRGKKARLSNATTIQQDIETLSKNRHGGRVKCDDIVTMVAQKYNVTYSRSGMYHVLKRLGFSWVTARSRHPKHDAIAQDNFKKFYRSRH